MLQRATAADPEVRASRHHTVRRGAQDFDQTGFVQLPAPLEHAQAHAFSPQCARDEYRLAVETRNSPAIVGQIHDVRFLNLAGGQLAGHAAANSFKCAAAESSSNLRTRALSCA